MAALIEPNILALRRFAWALLRDTAAADDLVQDCLERAIARWHLRRQDADAKAWLFAILHNLFRTGRRSASRRGQAMPLDEEGRMGLARYLADTTDPQAANALPPPERLALQRRIIFQVCGQNADAAARGIQHCFDDAARHASGTGRIGRPWQHMALHLRNPVF